MDAWTDWHWGRVFRQLVYAKDGHDSEGATADDPDATKWTYDSEECKAAVDKFVTEKTIMAAGTIIAAVFPVVLVMIFQRYLIARLSAGAVKG